MSYKLKRLLVKAKRNTAVGKVSTVTFMLVATLGFTSCEPDMCEDCYSYTYSDGTTEWMCIEYDCSDY